MSHISYLYCRSLQSYWLLGLLLNMDGHHPLFFAIKEKNFIYCSITPTKRVYFCWNIISILHQWTCTQLLSVATMRSGPTPQPMNAAVVVDLFWPKFCPPWIFIGFTPPFSTYACTWCKFPHLKLVKYRCKKRSWEVVPRSWLRMSECTERSVGVRSLFKSVKTIDFMLENTAFRSTRSFAWQTAFLCCLLLARVLLQSNPLSHTLEGASPCMQPFLVRGGRNEPIRAWNPAMRPRVCYGRRIDLQGIATNSLYWEQKEGSTMQLYLLKLLAIIKVKLKMQKFAVKRRWIACAEWIHQAYAFPPLNVWPSL